MRSPPNNPKAAQQTVSVTINSDLYAQAKRLNISASQVAEEAYQIVAAIDFLFFGV